MKMKLSEEMAVRLHRMMWSDMQRDLGNDPDEDYRLSYKRKWIEKHFGEDIKVANTCFLCDYAGQFSEYEPYCGSKVCSEHCPIQWPEYDCSRSPSACGVHYRFSPISEILALPARNGEKLESGPDLMSLAYCNAKNKLSEASGLEDFCTTEKHIKKIQEKAVEEYFESRPAAKMVSMDVDEAFKQYADEQKAPIFHALAEASGLSAGNDSVKAHISEIRSKAKYSGRKEAIEEIFKSLSIFSGVSPDIWAVGAHVDAIREKASNGKNAYASSLLEKYKNALSNQSGLDRDKPIDVHLREIVKISMEAGAAEERDRIQEKIYEELLS